MAVTSTKPISPRCNGSSTNDMAPTTDQSPANGYSCPASSCSSPPAACADPAAAASGGPRRKAAPAPVAGPAGAASDSDSDATTYTASPQQQALTPAQGPSPSDLIPTPPQESASPRSSLRRQSRPPRATSAAAAASSPSEAPSSASGTTSAPPSRASSAAARAPAPQHTPAAAAAAASSEEPTAEATGAAGSSLGGTSAAPDASLPVDDPAPADLKRIEIQADGKLSKYGALRAARGERYQVFISHAGEQGTNIVDYLYEYFDGHYPAVKVFLDRVALAKGGNNMRDMHTALQDSFVVILILSKDFIRKFYPMEELQLALERRRRELEACHAAQMAGQERFAARILPVFYDAKPEDVSAKIEDLVAAQARGMHAGEDFQRQAGRDLQLLQQLLGASYQAAHGGGQGGGVGPPDHDGATESSQCVRTLEGIGNVSGIRACEVADARATLLVELIVNETVNMLHDMNQLPRKKLQDLPILVGMDNSLDQLVQAFEAQNGALECRVVLLHGMGGAGKTVLAKAAFNTLHCRHPTMPCQFLSLTSGLQRDTPALHKELLLGLTCDRREYSSDERCHKLKDKLAGKRVLLVVDNIIGGLDGLAALKPIIDVLSADSMVLVTSRDGAASTSFLGARTVQLRPMCIDDAMTLFYMHALGIATTPGPYDTELVKERFAKEVGNRHVPRVPEFVNRCSGLPLALKAMGRHLRTILGRKPELTRFFKIGNRDEVLKRVYEDPREGGRPGGESLFGILLLTWQDLVKDKQAGLLDVVCCLKGQCWQLVDTHCGYQVIPGLQCLGLVRQERVVDGARGDVSQRVAVPDVIADFCKLEDSVISDEQREVHRGVTRHAAPEEDVALWLREQARLGVLRHVQLFRVLRLGGMLCGVSHLALPCLRWLWVEGATTPTTLPLQLRDTASLKVLLLQNLDHLQSVDGLGSCANLRAVCVTGCCRLCSVNLEGLEELEHLEVCHCNELQSVALRDLPELGHVDIRLCGKLRTISFEELPELEYTAASRQHGQSVLLKGLPELEELSIDQCEQLDCSQLWDDCRMLLPNLTYVGVAGH